MPKLVLIAACERCILDTDGSATLVNVFSALRFGTASAEIIPENATGPKEWAVYVQWDTVEDVGKTFVQKIEILRPGGGQFGHSEDTFTAQTPSHGIRTNVPGMPIGKEGDLLIKVWLEFEGKQIGIEHPYVIHLSRDQK